MDKFMDNKVFVLVSHSIDLVDALVDALVDVTQLLQILKLQFHHCGRFSTFAKIVQSLLVSSSTPNTNEKEATAMINKRETNFIVVECKS